MTESRAPFAGKGLLAAYLIDCPRCRAKVGDPCREGRCRQGVPGCTYADCYVLQDLPEPHVARVARAAASGAQAGGQS